MGGNREGQTGRGEDGAKVVAGERSHRQREQHIHADESACEGSALCRGKCRC